MIPGSPEWQRLITASKVAAILGVSPWASPRSTWHAMKGHLPRAEQTEAQSRGHYLEPAILAWWRDQHGVSDDPSAATWNNRPDYRFGDWAAATPDARAYVNEDEGWVLVEAKSAAFDDDWGDPGTDAIPAYYLTQVYFQLALSGAARCYVPVLTSRLRFVEYVVEANEAVQADLIARMKAFYDSLAADEPPPLDDSVATFDAVRKVHRDIERGESVELTEDEAWNLIDSAASVKCAEAEDRLARSTVLDRMGRAQYATHNGVRIARRQPRGADVSFVVVAKPSDLTQPEGDAA